MNLPHTITIERASDGADDDRGVPAQTWATSSTAQAWVQPKSAKDLMQLSQAGPVVSTHSIYVEPNADIDEADRVVFGGETYQLDGIKDEAGIGHHYKVDAHLVEAVPKAWAPGFSAGFGV